MKRIGTVLMVVGLVTALLTIPIAAAATYGVGDSPDQVSQAAPIENESIAPGAQLAGVVGVQEAEIRGDVDDRTFGIRIAAAQANETRANIVADRLGEVEERIADHEEKLAELKEARDAGNISEDTYRAKVATVVAEKNTTAHAATQAQNTTEQLPQALLEERGINVSAIQELSTRAKGLGGQETAAIARSIAGNDVGAAIPNNTSTGPPVDIDPGVDRDTDGGDDPDARNDGDADERGPDRDTP